MEKSEIVRRANELISEGEIEDALNFLNDVVTDPELSTEITYLKSKYHYNRDQYELKMVIDKKEYDLAWSKILIGTQHVISKINVTKKPPHTNGLLTKIGITALAILIASVGIFIATNNSQPAEADPTIKETVAYNFIGNWEAKVEHQGFIVDKGQKKKYINDVANWIIEVRGDHTALMKGTIDTTGRSELDWFYNTSNNTLRFIQEDETSFEVVVEKNEQDYQLWKSSSVQGIKTEEWVWTLQRK